MFEKLYGELLIANNKINSLKKGAKEIRKIRSFQVKSAKQVNEKLCLVSSEA